MHKKNCYLLLAKSKLKLSKAEIILDVKNGSASPNDCFVSMSAAQAQGDHYDFVRYCELFVMTKGMTSYVIVYAPDSYMSYYVIKFGSAIKFAITVSGNNFITSNVASMIYEYKKCCYSRPVDKQSIRMQDWREKIDEELRI